MIEIILDNGWPTLDSQQLNDLGMMMCQAANVALEWLRWYAPISVQFT